MVTLLDGKPRPAGRSLFGPLSQNSTGDCVTPQYDNVYRTTLELFKFAIGMGDMEFTDQYKYYTVFYVLMITYIVLTYILLLNMLIALMNKSVEDTHKESTSIWKLQVKTIHAMPYYDITVNFYIC